MPAVQGQGYIVEQQGRVYAKNTYEVVHDIAMITCALLLDSICYGFIQLW